MRDTRERKESMALKESMGGRVNPDSLVFQAAKGHRGQMACKENLALKEIPVDMEARERKVTLAKRANQEDPETTDLQDQRVTGVLVVPMVIKAREEMMDHQDQTDLEEREA